LKIFLFTVLFYIIPFIIGWFGVRWLVKNKYFENAPDMQDVMLVVTPIINIIVVLAIIVEFIIRNTKDFPQKFFRL